MHRIEVLMSSFYRLWPPDWRAWGDIVVLLALLLGGTGRPGHAQPPRAERTLDLQIRQSTTLEVQGAPEISIPELGQAAETPGDAATYALTTNTDKAKEIQASLNGLLPTGLSLEAKVEAPASKGNGVTSTGWAPLSTEEKKVLSGIQKADDSGVPIAYRAVASAVVAPGGYTFTVTYTITE
jgi:hypothetical protein